jgi:hypothetical protein
VKPNRAVSRASFLLLAFFAAGCGGGAGAPGPVSPQAAPSATPLPPAPTPTSTPAPTPTPSGEVTDDESLWRLLTVTDPFGGYRLFPGVEEISSGRIEGAGAHPRARVSLNATALRALENGKLPSGRKFPNGSVIFKEVVGQGVYAVMRKHEGGPVSGAGWAWAEFRTDGSVLYSTAGRGGVCIGCHSLQKGPENDLVRTFERQ